MLHGGGDADDEAVVADAVGGADDALTLVLLLLHCGHVWWLSEQRDAYAGALCASAAKL